jgi:hypothetical protein
MLRASLREKAPVRTLVHEYGKAELARADQHDSKDVRERVGENCNQRDRS